MFTSVMAGQVYQTAGSHVRTTPEGTLTQVRWTVLKVTAKMVELSTELIYVTGDVSEVKHSRCERILTRKFLWALNDSRSAVSQVS